MRTYVSLNQRRTGAFCVRADVLLLAADRCSPGISKRVPGPVHALRAYNHCRPKTRSGSYTYGICDRGYNSHEEAKQGKSEEDQEPILLSHAVLYHPRHRNSLPNAIHPLAVAIRL
jgi:hypothetical protein